jgi:DNA-binding IclR family transcriptional regulator
LSAVVKAGGLSPSQTHRYLASLVEAGMAKQDDSGSYDLGPAALRLGLGALARIDVFKVADAELGRLCGEAGCTVLLAALGPTGPIIVRWHVGRPPIVTSLAVGSRLSLLRSATGQVFLTFRPENETGQHVAEELATLPGLTRKDVEDIRTHVFERGYAEVGGTVIPGLHARAYPIFDIQGDAILVAAVLSTSDQADKTRRKDAAALKQACERISLASGGRSSPR